MLICWMRKIDVDDIEVSRCVVMSIYVTSRPPCRAVVATIES